MQLKYRMNSIWVSRLDLWIPKQVMGKFLASLLCCQKSFIVCFFSHYGSMDVHRSRYRLKNRSSNRLLPKG